MRRIGCPPRPDWRKRLADLGVDLEFNPASPYWREDAYYAFDDGEIEVLHEAGVEIERLILAGVDHVVRTGRFAELGIGPQLAVLAAESWKTGQPSLYGRYDLRFDGQTAPKLLEYNADTPTALFEASVVQWHWLEECHPGKDQFNSIHEALIALWTRWREEGRVSRAHFSCMDDDDDVLTTAYLQDTAYQAGLDVALMAVTDIGWDGRTFLDAEERRISTLFKLYPWDWLAREPFFAHLAGSPMKVLEPAWRVIAASKGILSILWELFPGHPNLLPASSRPAAIDGPTVQKPLFGREGANVVVSKGEGSFATPGDYAGMPTICQVYAPLPDFNGWHPVMGLWMIGGEPHGLGIREDRSLITGRAARFVPHVIEP